MKTRIVGGIVLLTAIWAVVAVTVNASDPVGVYAIVERTILEPNDTEPQRIQIWGAFVLSDGQSGDGYGTVQRGYLYYTCPPGQQNICRNEWADIKSVAGKSEGIGFGGRYRATGRVRRQDEKPASPDVYPIQMGVIRMGSRHDQPGIITRLKAALRER
jgi:hypothetical protein